MRKFYLIFVLLFTSACGLVSTDIEIRDAHIFESLIFEDSDNLYQEYDQVVQVSIRTDDARNLIRSNVYPYINVFDCKLEDKRFPVFPFYGKIAMDEFRQLERSFGTQPPADYIEIYGGIEKSFVDEIDEPCVDVSGGNVIGYIIKSNSLKLGRLKLS
ncbi:hypothetical protein [Parasphingorhabdus sp.]|uniref:hypothetical protein n=1 Tax=Parasphingorhabdus sp. TaxID=2709688 RepID=UPI00359476EC